MPNPKHLLHLKLRYRTYWLKLPIPRRLRHLFLSKTGNPRTHIEETLSTDNLAEANRAKRRREVYWQTEFTRLSIEQVGRTTEDADEAARWRQAFGEAANDPTSTEVMDSLLADRAYEIEALAGEEAAHRFVANARARQSLREALTDWFALNQHTPGTKAKYDQALRELLSFMKVADAVAQDVTEDVVREYVHWLNHAATTPAGKVLSHGTKDDRLKSLGSIWKRLTRQGLATKGSVELWRGHDLSGKRKPQDGDEGEKRPYTDTELVRLLQASPGPRATTYPARTLHELHALGLLTGARLDELCSRRLGDVERIEQGYVLHIRRAKTPNGIRSIPITHAIGVALLDRRIGKRADVTEQLFPECKPGGKDKKLSHYAVNALRNLRDNAGFTTETDFHSTRRNLSSVLEAREVYPIAADRYTGHAPPGLTFGLYAKGESEAMLKVAHAIRYPDAVEAAMRKALDL